MDRPTLIDAAFIKLNQFFKNREDLKNQTRIAASIPMKDFMKYRAIIDIDGNGWSSRFGDLLCTNSVVVKIQPDFGERFYEDLVPWEHYIPVNSNLTSLAEAVKFVADDLNKKKVKKIIHNANQWCRSKFLRYEILKDMLHVLVEISDILDSQDSQWREGWKKNTTSSEYIFDDLVAINGYD